MSGIVWDDREFRTRLRRLQAQYPTAADKAAAQVARQVLNDCIMEPPTVPIDTGNLRSTGTFEVVHPSPSVVRIYVGFNAPYAAKVHEVPMNFQEPAAGNKYLEAKLLRHKVEYIRVWVRKTRQMMGGTGLPMAAGGGGGGG